MKLSEQIRLIGNQLMTSLVELQVLEKEQAEINSGSYLTSPIDFLSVAIEKLGRASRAIAAIEASPNEGIPR